MEKYIALLVSLTAFALILECLSLLLVRWLKLDFQWLITSSDEQPALNREKLKKFLGRGYEPVLGWERKPNTSREEPVRSAGEERKRFPTVTYHINDNKCRLNPGHEHLPVMISSYGDSFAFARHVNDNQTWQWYLSELTNSNVQNFGVGNYGMDQSLVRLKREFAVNKSRIVVMMVVPETIIRIVNIWKHYCEYGNTLGFKGRFVLNGQGLTWLENPMNATDKFNAYWKYLGWIQSHDYCYKNKFRKDQLRFPYCLRIIANGKRNGPLLKALLIRKIYKMFDRENENILNRPWEIILKENFKFAVSLYRSSEVTELLYQIAISFKQFVTQNGSTPLLVMAPYLHEIEYLRRGESYYQPLLERMNEQILTLDLGNAVLGQNNPSSLFVSNLYGAHLSDKGNQFAAGALYEFIQNNHILHEDVAHTVKH